MMFETILLSIAISSTPHSLLKQADIFIQNQHWEEAAQVLDEYSQISKKPKPEALYDRGVAHYNLGQFSIAADSFDNALAISNDPSLKTYSAFNMGNAIYQQTMQDLEGTGTEAPTDEDIIALEDAKSKIYQVLDQYRMAIAQDSTDMDARANGELAWIMLQQLDKMQEQMEKEQQEQQEQGDSEQEQQDSDQSEDSGKSDNSENLNDQKDQQQQDGEPKDGEQTEHQQENQPQDNKQSENGEQSDEQQDKQEQDGDQSDEPDQQDGEQQLGEQDSMPQEDPNEQESGQPQIDEGELEATKEEMNKAKELAKYSKDEGERLSEAEAQRLLQLVRDKEQQRRKALAARRAENRVPVEKDW